MTISAEILRQLHRIHRQRSDLMSRLARGPKQVAARQENCKLAEANLVATKEKLTKTKMVANEKELQLGTRESRVKDLQGKLNACSSNKEYQTLKEQIAADEQANSVLADEILEILNRIEGIEQDVIKAEKNIEIANQDLETTQKKIQNEKELLENDLARINDELGTVEAKLPGDFRGEYERLARARGHEALACVEGDSCGGCNQMLNPQTINNLMLNKPVFCSICGSLLYLPEDRSPGR